MLRLAIALSTTLAMFTGLSTHAHAAQCGSSAGGSSVKTGGGGIGAAEVAGGCGAFSGCCGGWRSGSGRAGKPLSSTSTGGTNGRTGINRG